MGATVSKTLEQFIKLKHALEEQGIQFKYVNILVENGGFGAYAKEGDQAVEEPIVRIEART